MLGWRKFLEVCDDEFWIGWCGCGGLGGSDVVVVLV